MLLQLALRQMLLQQLIKVEGVGSTVELHDGNNYGLLISKSTINQISSLSSIYGQMNILESIRNTSFVEVNVNSTKLNQLLDSISSSIHLQNIQIHSNHQHIIHQINLLQQQYKNLLTQVEHVHLTITQDISRQSTSISSLKAQSEGNLQAIHHQMHALTTQIASLKQSSKVDCGQVESMLRREIMEAQEVYQQKNDFIDAWINNLGEKLKKIQTHTRQEMEKVTYILAHHQTTIQSNNAQLNKQQSKQQFQLDSKLEDGNSIMNFTVTAGDEFFVKRQPPGRKRCDSTEILKFATISAKLEHLEHRLNQKDSTPLNRVIYPTNKSPKMHIDKSSNQISSAFIQNNQQTSQLGGVQENIYKQLKLLDDYIVRQFNILKDQTNTINNKNIVLQQKMAMLNRKVQKEYIIINDCKEKVKRIQQKKVDENLVQSLLNQIKLFKNHIQQLLQSKASKESLEIQKVKMNNRANIIHENLVEKADKGQIKKAFLFLEDKIKEIVVLIADQKMYQKDGVISKLPFKCLSCDRDLDINLRNIQSSAMSTPNPNNMSLRSVTSKLKRRRKINQNASMPKIITK